jgi:GWxTD domain-containing protein
VQTAGNTKALYKARDFGVKSLNFPAVRTPSERAAPLACLMRGKYLHDHPKLLKKIKSPEQAVRLIPKDSSYSKLMALTDPDSLCSVVARFWQDRLGWGQKAQRVEQLYYRRVETANVLFSDYKAGWKTGRGMTYILFGRPCDVWYFPKLSFSGQTPAAHGHDIFGWDYGDCHYNCGYLITSCVGINDYSGTFNHGVAHYGVGFYAPHGNSPRFPFQRCLIVRGARYRFKLRHPHAIKTPRDDITADLIREVQRQRQLWFSGKILHRKLYWLPLSGKMTGGPAFYDSTTDRMAY